MQGQQAPMQMQQGMQAPMTSNEGVAPQMMQQDPNMGHPASASYNQQFGYGGQMQYSDGGPMWTPGAMFGDNQRFIDEFNPVPTAPSREIPSLNFSNLEKILPEMTSRTYGTPVSVSSKPPVQGEQNNPLRYAPLAANLFSILSARKSPSTQSQMSKMGYKTSIDENLGSQVSPRQTLFGNVDMSQIERGIGNQARGFTGTNLNVSGGNAGQFIANELGNQSNVMNAIANARMQSQQMDQRTQAMNAQEQARIDQFLQGQAGQRQQAQAQNIGIGMQLADLDARNLGAFNTNRANQIAGLATNLGNIGKEEDQMKMIANALGYTSFGNFLEGLSPEDKTKFLPGLLQMLKLG
jgi:hypothetical protein